ncbi:MAG: hypothetical protein HY000_16725 [Planctomycetes bacterium]|nr:hypothetical protein [Planctomycetota bacterium]
MRPATSFVLSLIAVMPLVAVGFTGCSSKSGGSTAGGKSASGKAELMCREHGVPEKFCTICHPEIKNDPNILLCKEHGHIPEDICTACHPELKAKIKTCPHELPPAFCPECQKKG